MKKITFIFCFLFTINNVWANEALNTEILSMQKKWEEAKYVLKEKDQRLAKYQECASDGEKLVKRFPDKAEPIIWQGICTASQAELLKLSALGKAKDAKALFENSLEIDKNSLNGSAYVNLGVLYHRVPGWPIGFGDSDLAEENFKKALTISPNNIDANYFYGLFLKDNGEDKTALKYFNAALNAPARPNRPFADKMRKKEIMEKINEIQE